MNLKHYEAATTGAAIVPKDWMGLLILTGSDRIAWLQGMVTNDVEKLAAGDGCYAGHLNAQGKLIAQMIVLALADELWLLVERAACRKLASAFERLIIMEDVQIRNVTDDYAVWSVTGPQASAVIASRSGSPLDGLYRHELRDGIRMACGDLGYDLIVKREGVPDLIRSLTASGASLIDADTWNVLRVEAGLPLYGVDLDETTTLPELGQRGIDYDKGCYIGQEVVAKIKYIGHVNRRFVGLVCEGDAAPEAQSVVRRGEKEVGYVTSGIYSPRMGKPVALGFVSRTAAEPGTSVELATRRGVVTARVAALPF